MKAFRILVWMCVVGVACSAPALAVAADANRLVVKKDASGSTVLAVEDPEKLLAEAVANKAALRVLRQQVNDLERAKGGLEKSLADRDKEHRRKIHETEQQIKDLAKAVQQSKLLYGQTSNDVLGLKKTVSDLAGKLRLAEKAAADATAEAKRISSSLEFALGTEVIMAKAQFDVLGVGVVTGFVIGDSYVLLLDAQQEQKLQRLVAGKASVKKLKTTPDGRLVAISKSFFAINQ